MCAKYKKKVILKTLAVLIATIGFTTNVRALNDDMTVVDGIRYRTLFVPSRYSLYNFGEGVGTCYTLEHVTKSWKLANRDNCKAGGDYNTFLFDDGSELPAFLYPAMVLRSNSIYQYKGLSIETAKIDSISNRYPFYTGEVWLQDSVPMQNLPNLREKKYHLVCDIEKRIITPDDFEEEVAEQLFDEELTFIRTPRYAVVRTWTFKNQYKLKTARIGAVQYVARLAFENCPELETVYFERSPYVDDYAFFRCNNIKYIVIDCKLPKKRYSVKIDADRSPFDLPVYDKAILYVPADQIEAYRNDKVWGKFRNIRDIEEYTSGVEAINPDIDVEYHIYNLSGVLLRSVKSEENWREGLPSGVYIMKSSLGAVKKEYIK